MGLAETKGFQMKIASLKDENTSRRLLEACEQIAKKFRKYMLVRTIASIATGFAVWGFAHVVGLELAAALGVLSFALNYLPYVGALAAIVFPALFAFFNFRSGEMVIFVLIGLMVIRFVIGSLIEPIFSGSALAIAPPVVVFAIVLWTFLWGVPVPLLASPWQSPFSLSANSSRQVAGSQPCCRVIHQVNDPHLKMSVPNSAQREVEGMRGLFVSLTPCVSMPAPKPWPGALIGCDQGTWIRNSKLQHSS